MERQVLEKHLSRLLGFGDDSDESTISDIFDHLIFMDSSEEIRDYVMQLLGGESAEVNGDVHFFVQNMERFQRGEKVSQKDDSTSSSTNKKEITDKNNNESSDRAAVRIISNPLSKDNHDGTAKQKHRRNNNNNNGGGGGGGGGAANKSNSKTKSKERGKKPSPMRATTELQDEAKRPQKTAAASVAATTPTVAKPNSTTTNNNNIHEKKAKQNGNTKTDASGKSQSLRQEKKTQRRGKPSVVCGCFGTLHKPLANCLHCGRIACEKEGYDFCPFCGFLIQMLIVKKMPDGSFDKALLHKERLLQFDRESAQRTTVLDDQADYYSNTSSAWLTNSERHESKLQDDEKRKLLHKRNMTMKLNIDL